MSSVLGPVTSLYSITPLLHHSVTSYCPTAKVMVAIVL